MNYLNRNTPVAPVNRDRSTKMHDRNFGPRAAAIRAMLCTVARHHCEDHAGPSRHIRNLLGQGHDAAKLACSSDKPEAAHGKGARGMGSCNTDDNRGQLPLCHHHHVQAGERGTSERAAFEELYNISVEAEADRIAVELDARGLA